MKKISTITKSLFIIFTMLSSAHAEALVLTLKPDNAEEPKNANGDYTEQVIQQFKETLKKNAELKKQFDQYETDAVGDEEERGGRYLGIGAQGFVMHQSEEVDFHAREGELSKCDYSQTIVVYFSYNKGV